MGNDKVLIDQGNGLEVDLRTCPVERLDAALPMASFDAFLDFAYLILLKRMPDPEGRSHYRALAVGGLSREAVVQRLLRAAEHRLTLPTAPGLPADEFLNRAYQDVLGRWPDSAGLETYRQRAGRASGRRRVLRDLARSTEARQRGGGRHARILALHRFARASRLDRLPLIGTWLMQRRQNRLRLAQLELRQELLLGELRDLRRQLAAFESEAGSRHDLRAPGDDDNPADRIFHAALARAMRERQLG